MEQLLRFQWWETATWLALVEKFGPSVARALFLGFVTWCLARAARTSLDRAIRPTGADANLRLLADRTIYLLVLAVGAITILDTFDVPLSTVVTLLGVVGIGIGLALQDILKSFFAGVYLLFERPFRIGEEVSVKDYRGVVETIGVRTTTLRTPENAVILVPNALVLTEVVANRTHERRPDAPPSDGRASLAPAGPSPSPAPEQRPELTGAMLKLSLLPRSFAEGALVQIRRFWLWS